VLGGRIAPKLADHHERGEDLDAGVQGEARERHRPGRGGRVDQEADLHDVPTQRGVLQAQAPRQERGPPVDTDVVDHTSPDNQPPA
jgi:hypothetical protein